MKLLYLTILIFVSIFPCAGKNILILHSNHNGLFSTDELNRGVKNVFDSCDNTTIFIEYLDAKRFPQNEYYANHFQFFTSKYYHYPPDAIVCVDNSALDFVIRLKGSNIFKSTPVFGAGISRIEKYDTTLQNTYFIITYDYYKERVEFIKSVLPETQRIHFIIDKSSTGQFFKQRMMRLSKTEKKGVQFEFYAYSTADNLTNYIHKLIPGEDVIDYFAVNKGSNGGLVNRDKIGLQIIANAKVPVFSNISALLGKGTIGEIDQSNEEQGILAAKLAHNLLINNISPKNKVYTTPSRYILDYLVLDKYNIRIPRESDSLIVLNRPEKIYTKYKFEFFLGLLGLIILSIIIVMLLYSRAKSNLMEKSLINSEQKFKEIVELLPQIVYECDIMGNIKFVNKQGIEIFGYTKEDLEKGINLYTVLIEVDRERAKKNIQLISKGIRPSNSIYTGIKKDGSVFPLEIHSTVIYEGIYPVGLRGIGIDMTKQKEIEKELIVAKERAEQSDKLKSAFLSNMSHEIRTPLNSIIGFSNLLTDDFTTSQEKEEFKKYILSSSEYLLNLINDIVDYSKIEAGQLELLKSEFNLSALMKELYTYYLSDKVKKNKDHVGLICKNLSENEESFIEADPVRTKQILTNLLDNAFKFTEKGKIEFGFRQTDARILFYVKDSGIGISEKSKELIFKRFFKLFNEDGKVYPGSGLGLSICRNLVYLMGGKLWVESVVGEGSTFFFELPLTIKLIPKVLSTEGLPSDFTNRGIENKRILIAEDEDSNYEFLAVVLKKAKAELIRATNGREAVQIALTQKIDLILMDIQMPILNGAEAIKEIKRTKSNIPIIAQTAYAMAGEKEMIMQTGSDAYISKPIDPNLLLDLISQLLRY